MIGLCGAPVTEFKRGDPSGLKLVGGAYAKKTEHTV